MLPRLRTRMVVWTTDAVRYESPLGVMVLSNTRSYGGVVSFAPGACATDGLLDMAALCPRRRGDGLRLSYRLLAKRLQVDARATTGQVAELAMETPGLAVQLDGDHAGETPMRFTVEPGALLVSVPSGRLPAVMSEEERG
jgi:diacylglycerol kinase family enzyme